MPAAKVALPPPDLLSPRSGHVLLLVGTVKGLFVLESAPGRARWNVSGPFFRGHSVYAAAWDGRAGRHRIWAGPSSMHFGAELCSTDDFGGHWERPGTPLVRFPKKAGATLVNIWQITPGRDDEPDSLYCGVEPSALFESRDAGKSWALNSGLWDHPHRSRWQPGGGGLCLHTVLVDPARRGRATIASSTGGAYRTDDGGKSWHVKNRGVRAEFLPDPMPEFGQCVHKMVQHPAAPGRLYLQNHWGLYRSDDAGDSWRDVANGVPSDFGFCMGIHPRDPDTVFIIPLHSDGFRCVPEGKLRVYKTTDGGKSWKPLTRGLPQKEAFETVVRDAMAVDGLDPAGVYFGTRSGKLYGSRNEGRDWELIRDGLPAIVCVRAAIVGQRRAATARAPRRAAKAPARSRRAS
jgi:photosystem II stability/assembly factor-like uncharacterized protein